MVMASGMREAQVGCNASVGKNMDVFSPIKFPAEQFHAGERRAMLEMSRIVIPSESVEPTCAKIAAGHNHGLVR